MELTESILREQLGGVLLGDIVAVEILQDRNDKDRFGATFYARDSKIMGFTSRMKSFAREGRTPLMAFCQRMVDALRTVPDDEPLYSWAVTLRGKAGRVYGVSTSQRLLGILPDDYLGPMRSS